MTLRRMPVARELWKELNGEWLDRKMEIGSMENADPRHTLLELSPEATGEWTRSPGRLLCLHMIRRANAKQTCA